MDRRFYSGSCFALVPLESCCAGCAQDFRWTLQAKIFLDDFRRATDASSAFDARLSAAGNNVSSEYADLLALSARQVMSSLDITLAKNVGGEWELSDTKVFMKNMGSAGSDVSSTG